MEGGDDGRGVLGLKYFLSVVEVTTAGYGFYWVIFLIMLHGGYFESLEEQISSVIHGAIYAMQLAFLPGVNEINNMEASLMEEVNVYTLRLKVLPLSNAAVTALHKRILRVYVLQL
nr:hypothetical protein [Tanacetum cinerariifolium]